MLRLMLFPPRQSGLAVAERPWQIGTLLPVGLQCAFSAFRYWPAARSLAWDRALGPRMGLEGAQAVGTAKKGCKNRGRNNESVQIEYCTIGEIPELGW